MTPPSLSLPVDPPRPSRRVVRSTMLAVFLVGVLLLANSAASGGATGPPSTPAVDSSVPYGYSVDIEQRINTSSPETEPIPTDAELTVIANQGRGRLRENTASPMENISPLIRLTPQMPPPSSLLIQLMIWYPGSPIASTSEKLE